MSALLSKFCLFGHPLSAERSYIACWLPRRIMPHVITKIAVCSSLPASRAVRDSVRIHWETHAMKEMTLSLFFDNSYVGVKIRVASCLVFVCLFLHQKRCVGRHCWPKITGWRSTSPKKGSLDYEKFNVVQTRACSYGSFHAYRPGIVNRMHACWHQEPTRTFT